LSFTKWFLFYSHSQDCKILSLSSSSFAVLGFEFRAYTSSHSTSPFCVSYFQDRVSQTICPDWLQTVILLISAFE
jgi:hypothetical protein